MDLLGFIFTKIAGSRNKTFDFPFKTNTNVQFEEVIKEKTDAVKDIFSISFSSSLDYLHGDEKEKKESKDTKESKEQKDAGKQAEISFKGVLSLALDKEESKELQKLWKKKEVPEKMREPLFNFILRKTIIRALALEDELGIPPHLSLPKVKFQQPN